MTRGKKYAAEFIGTYVLVLFGCGTAVFTGGIGGVLGILGIALAFGLAVTAMSYAIGHVSGCHLNPAVSLAMMIDGRLSPIDFAGYVIAQLLGSVAASSTIVFLLYSTKLNVVNTGLGANGYGSESFVGLSLWGALAVEFILTFVFVLTVLGVTSDERTASHAGIIIGLTLCFVHILGIALTGTSVNPARSFGPAVVYGGTALRQLWVFIAAPLVGASLAAVLRRYFFRPSEAVKTAQTEKAVPKQRKKK